MRAFTLFFVKLKSFLMTDLSQSFQTIQTIWKLSRPNHVLQLRSKPLLPPGLFQESDLYIRRRWRQVQYLSDLFWKRWIREYLSLLQECQKWMKPRRNFVVGDIVVIMDPTAPRGSWSLGKIIQTYPDKKGFVRSVQLKTKTGLLDRPVSKLCLLLEDIKD